MSSADMTGTVIDSGDGVTHVFPVCDGYVIGSCVKSVPLAGRDITKFTLQSLRDRGEKFAPEDSNEIAMKIKEKYGYVCKDVMKEYEKYDKKTADESGKFVQSNKFKRLVHKTLNGNMVNIDVGYERFLGPEMFFHPVSKHLQVGFHRRLTSTLSSLMQVILITGIHPQRLDQAPGGGRGRGHPKVPH